MASQTQQITVVKLASPGEVTPSEIFKTVSVPTPSAKDLENGHVLVETLYLSLDPAMRLWLEGGGYTNLEPGQVMKGPSLVRVLDSRIPNVVAGDVGHTFSSGWTTHAIVAAPDFQKVTVHDGTKLTDSIGFLGLTGLTGYFGMIRVGKPKAGETVVVSTAAGATGCVAAQVAKIQGARVIGITGSDEKVQWLKEIGLDEAINYKAPDFEEQFTKATEGGIDVYFDNVGGAMLESAINKLNQFARVALCGNISSYNSEKPYGITNYFQLVLRSSIMQGVNIFDYLGESEAGRAQLLAWAQEGKIKRTETVVKGGLEDAPAALLELFKGKNIGKMLLEIKSPEA